MLVQSAAAQFLILHVALGVKTSFEAAFENGRSPLKHTSKVDTFSLQRAGFSCNNRKGSSKPSRPQSSSAPCTLILNLPTAESTFLDMKKLQEKRRSIRSRLGASAGAYLEEKGLAGLATFGGPPTKSA